MSATNALHVVVGASGATGRLVVRELASRWKSVRAVNRSGRVDVPEGVEVRKGEATSPYSMREVCQGTEVVYHCGMPPFSK